MKSRIVSFLILCIGLLAVQLSLEAQTTRNLKYKVLPHYRLYHDRNIPGKDIEAVEKELQRAYEVFSGRLGFSPSAKMTVYLYSSRERTRGDLLSSVLDDSYYDNGKIIIFAPAIHDEHRNLQTFVDRVVARAFAGTIIRCPAWLSDVYAFGVSYDFTRFGKPTRGHLASFSDLGEDLQSAEGKQEFLAVYANIAATAKYFMDQYGESKFDKTITLIHNGRTLEEAMADALGAKYDEVERAWAQYMNANIRR